MQPETITFRRSPEFVCKTRVRLSHWGNRKKDPLREAKLGLFIRVTAAKSHHFPTAIQQTLKIARSMHYKISG